jgi:methylmalonyl-CoA/ethylmalonyl-CoA epimerase
MDFKIEHIGYITKSIEKTAESFKVLGYTVGDIVNDDTQKTRICFLRKEGELAIELVEPYPENATMQKMLKKGTTPYHTCYTVPDVQAVYDQLKKLGFAPLFSPVAAPAFENRLICYFWKNDIGLIEVVEQEKGE